MVYLFRDIFKPTTVMTKFVFLKYSYVTIATILLSCFIIIASYNLTLSISLPYKYNTDFCIILKFMSLLFVTVSVVFMIISNIKNSHKNTRK